jgi:amino acid transporter
MATRTLRARLPETHALRRQLGFLGTVSLSIGVMAPTLAMAVTGSHAAGLVGRAAPLAYALSAIGVAFVAYGFIRLASHFAHAGSVYAFTGLSLGPRAGFISGWALLGTYIVFPAVSILGIAVFSQAFLRHTGIADSPPWWPFALAGWAVIGLLATRNVRTTTRSLLAVELAAVVLILALVVVIFAKLATGDAPHGLGFSGDFVRLPDGVGLSTVVFAASVGFLSFAGFEAAGSFGEESKRPTHTIPRSMIGAIAFGGVFYVICMIAQTLGFGTDAAGVKTFSESAAPLGDLGQAYVGSGMGEVLDLVAIVSSIGAGLGCTLVGARTMFAFGRDRLLRQELSGVSTTTGVPTTALALELTLSLVAIVCFAIAGTRPLDAFFYLATMGILSLLVMYVITNIGALRYLFFAGEPRVPVWEIVFPLGGIAFAVYTLYKNVWPVPAYPFNLFPYVVAGWLAIGICVTLLVPGFVGRIEEHLSVRVLEADTEAALVAPATSG